MRNKFGFLKIRMISGRDDLGIALILMMHGRSYSGFSALMFFRFASSWSHRHGMPTRSSKRCSNCSASIGCARLCGPSARSICPRSSMVRSSCTNPVFSSLEQYRADPLLQCAYISTKGRLRQTQPVCGALKRTGLKNNRGLG